MKIGLIYLGRRGAGLPISFAIARQLTQTDEVLMVLSDTAESAADWKSLGVDVLSAQTYDNLRQAVWTWVDQGRISRLAGQIDAWKPDVLLFPMFYTWNPFLQAHLSHIPTVVTVHDPRPHPGFRDKLFQLLEDRSIHQAARCLVFSQALLPELIQRGVPGEKIDVIKLGMFDHSRDERYPEPGKVLEGDTPSTLLFFGRITAYKGLGILLKAYQSIQDRYNIRLVIAGEGNLRSYHSLIKARYGVELINRWIADEDIPAIFHKADIVILPYTSATQSGVIPLAASFALPVIATRSGGIPEQIDDGVNGLLVEPGSVEQLSEAIQRLLDDPEMRSRLGLKLRRDFQEKYSWEQTTAIIKSALEKAYLG